MYLDPYELEKNYKLNQEPAVAAKAEQHRVLADAGLIRRSWLSCQVCRSLWRLGRLLVATGLRLEQRYVPVALGAAYETAEQALG